ncbi:sortase [Candidatus Roizmanbacteria bacterium]|nr:sortase [Candidatus Roizmanbacteria bacterium]
MSILEGKTNLLFKLGLILFSTGILLFFLSFYRVLWQETKYIVLPKKQNIKPVDEEFGIVIPKISANAKVIEKVDPFNQKEYQWALTKGVAHAKGTAYPGSAGNSFIFAHSSVDWYIANQYNSVFYLLHKLEKGDKIEMYYKKKKYVYEVTAKKYVDASDVSYLDPTSQSTSVLTLMTCWPPGTTYKRLIIQAKISLDK